MAFFVLSFWGLPSGKPHWHSRWVANKLEIALYEANLGVVMCAWSDRAPRVTAFSQSSPIYIRRWNYCRKSKQILVELENLYGGCRVEKRPRSPSFSDPPSPLPRCSFYVCQILLEKEDLLEFLQRAITPTDTILKERKMNQRNLIFMFVLLSWEDACKLPNIIRTCSGICITRKRWFAYYDDMVSGTFKIKLLCMKAFWENGITHWLLLWDLSPSVVVRIRRGYFTGRPTGVVKTPLIA